MKTIITFGYLFLFLFWGLLFCYSSSASDDDEVVEYNVQVSNRFDVLAVEETAAEHESEQVNEQHADATESWQVTTNTLNSEQEAEIYKNIREQLASNPVAAEFSIAFLDQHPIIERLYSWHNCIRLSTDPRRLRVFAAAMGLNSAGYEVTSHIKAIDIAWRVLESREMLSFGWYQVGTALLITGELQQNRHIDRTLNRFYRRYGHLSQQFEITGDIDLETLQLHIERFNQAVIDTDRGVIGQLRLPVVLGCLSTLLMLAYQVSFCQK